MTQRRLILVLALLATVAWTAASFGQATLTFSSPTGVKTVSNGYVMTAAGDQVTLAFAGVTYPATLRIFWDTQNTLPYRQPNSVTLKFIDSATTADGTFGASPNRTRWALNMPLPGTYYIGAQLIDAVGTVNAWAACTINYTCWFHNVWQPISDGSQNTYYGGAPGEGYASRQDGSFRLSKNNQHYGWMTFFGTDPTPMNEGLSDNTDGTSPGHSRNGNPDDGVVMLDWLAGKKLVLASLYWRDSTDACSTFNDPTEIIGFRVSNQGIITDVPAQGVSVGSTCCAGYDAPATGAGLSAPPAWRMGAPWKDWSGTLGYNLKGDAGEFANDHEWYKVSNFDTTSPNKKGLEVVASPTNTWFGSPYVPYTPGTADYDQGGWTSHPRNATGGTMSGAGRFAFGWLVEVSNAHITNSLAVNFADCQAGAEPRDHNMTGNLDDGWFGQKLDNGLVYAAAHRDTTEVKALVFSSYKTALYNNPQAYSRDQNGGQFAPFVYVWKATYNGDCALPLDGCVDADDLLAFAAAFGNSPYDAECDFNFDSNVDISDLLALAVQWNSCIPGAPY